MANHNGYSFLPKICFESGGECNLPLHHTEPFPAQYLSRICHHAIGSLPCVFHLIAHGVAHVLHCVADDHLDGVTGLQNDSLIVTAVEVYDVFFSPRPRHGREGNVWHFDAADGFPDSSTIVFWECLPCPECQQWNGDKGNDNQCGRPNQLHVVHSETQPDDKDRHRP